MKDMDLGGHHHGLGNQLYQANADALKAGERPDAAAAPRHSTIVPDEVASTSSSFLEDSMQTAKLLLAGGLAGAVSKTATAPLARLTILYQVQGLRNESTGKPSVREAFRHIVRQEGFRALWKGNGVTIIHRLPYSSVNFWTYERLNELWKQHVPPGMGRGYDDILRRLAAGGGAGLTACTLAYPLDLVRTRLAAQTTQLYYQGISHALSTIVRDEGVVGLYRGLWPTLVQVAPALAINYAAYETLRSHWLTTSKRKAPTVPMSLLCGSLAGLVSSTATFPLDLVRRRLQLEGLAGRPARYASYAEVFTTIVQKDGVRGLYAGILPEYYKVVPGVAIAFCTYELMKKYLGVNVNATNR